MGRSKFEKRLGKQLQNREITPSKAAWNKLSEQLSALDYADQSNSFKEHNQNMVKKRKRNRIYALSIAASLIGLVFISVFFLTRKEASKLPSLDVTAVETDSVRLFDKPDKKTLPAENEALQTTVVHSSKPKRNAVKSSDQTDFNLLQNQNISSGKNGLTTSVKNDDKFRQDKVRTKIGIGKEAIHQDTTKESKMLAGADAQYSQQLPNSIINVKIAEVVAQVAVLEQNNQSVSDAEIDSLLRSAQAQILKDQLFRKDASVDAMVLLADVEQELDRSFRDRIFDALKDGFVKVRTAVADRN